MRCLCPNGPCKWRDGWECNPRKRKLPDPCSVADRSDRTRGSLAAQRTDEVETNAVNSPPFSGRAESSLSQTGGEQRIKMTTWECLKYLYQHRPTKGK